MTSTAAVHTIEPAARVSDAVKVYGSGATEARALDGVSVAFPRRSTAIMDRSGSGKSTLMHCAAGTGTVTSGSAHIGDTSWGRWGTGS